MLLPDQTVKRYQKALKKDSIYWWDIYQFADFKEMQLDVGILWHFLIRKKLITTTMEDWVKDPEVYDITEWLIPKVSERLKDIFTYSTERKDA